MAITNIDELLDALGNRATSAVINKSSFSNALAGQPTSLWRAAGIPAQGAIPTSAAVCNGSLLGTLSAVPTLTGEEKCYLARMFLVSTVTAVDVQVHDRLVHMGGMSGIVTTPQTAAVTLVGMSADRTGPLTALQWWLEWYVDTGVTARVATVTYTNEAGTSGQTTTVSIAATTRAGRMMAIIPTNGEGIRSIESVTLNGTTGTLGNFGVTATRALGGLSLGVANAGTVGDWASLGLPEVHQDACLSMIMLPGTTATGGLYGNIRIVKG